MLPGVFAGDIKIEVVGYMLDGSHPRASPLKLCYQTPHDSGLA
jgi:hypothetical protein